MSIIRDRLRPDTGAVPAMTLAARQDWKGMERYWAFFVIVFSAEQGLASALKESSGTYLCCSQTCLWQRRKDGLNKTGAVLSKTNALVSPS